MSFFTKKQETATDTLAPYRKGPVALEGTMILILQIGELSISVWMGDAKYLAFIMFLEICS